MILTRSLSNSTKQNSGEMQVQEVQDKIQAFLEKKFRTSRSFSTLRTYEVAVNWFIGFLRVDYNLDLVQLLRQVKGVKKRDPIEVLDDYYSYLSNTRGQVRTKLALVMPPSDYMYT